VWIALVAVLGSFAGRLSDVEENDPVSFLPGSAESVAALEAVQRFPSGDRTPAVIVYHRDGGLTVEDRATIARDRLSLNTRPPRGVPPIARPVLSRDGEAALLVVPIDTSGPTTRCWTPSTRCARWPTRRPTGWRSR